MSSISTPTCATTWAPALGRPAPRTDELRIAVVLEWMIAVLGNQLRAVHIAGAAAEFPDWGTARSSWREWDVKIDGDVDLGAAMLDSLKLV